MNQPISISIPEGEGKGVRGEKKRKIGTGQKRDFFFFFCKAITILSTFFYILFLHGVAITF